MLFGDLIDCADFRRRGGRPDLCGEIVCAILIQPEPKGLEKLSKVRGMCPFSAN